MSSESDWALAEIKEHFSTEQIILRTKASLAIWSEALQPNLLQLDDENPETTD